MWLIIQGRKLCSFQKAKGSGYGFVGDMVWSASRTISRILENRSTFGSPLLQSLKTGREDEAQDQRLLGENSIVTSNPAATGRECHNP